MSVNVDREKSQQWIGMIGLCLFAICSFSNISTGLENLGFGLMIVSLMLTPIATWHRLKNDKLFLVAVTLSAYIWLRTGYEISLGAENGKLLLAAARDWSKLSLFGHCTCAERGVTAYPLVPVAKCSGTFYLQCSVC